MCNKLAIIGLMCSREVIYEEWNSFNSPFPSRSGHGHFAAYHERFGHEEETDLYCTCGQKRAQLHPFSCPNARAHRALLWCKKTKRHLGPEEILGTPEGALIFAEWAPATGLFKRRN